jgi:hypothetical protein
MDDLELSAVGGCMLKTVAYTQVPKLRVVQATQHCIVVTRSEKDFCPLPGLGEDRLEDVGVRLLPLAAFHTHPKIDDVANQVEVPAFDRREELGELFDHTTCRTQVDV